MEKLTDGHRITRLFEGSHDHILSIYFTAGYPKVSDTIPVIRELSLAGVDLIEVGMPYSDPVADGPTIQASNMSALKNGMSVPMLMEQLKGLRELTDMPVILMGYTNPILQYGMEKFCQHCSARGIDGLIIPDLPMQEYLDHYQPLFQENGLHNIFLITPQTSDERIRWIDDHSESFIYAVSDASITGSVKDISGKQEAYFQRLNNMKLKHPFLIGFGIYDHQTFLQACRYAPGAIIGSAFIKALQGTADIGQSVPEFVQSIKTSKS